MASDHLSTYLSDHLAGAIAAIEMLTHLADEHSNLVDLDVVHSVRREVEEDRATLQSLMSRVDVDASRPRRFVGWLAERATRLKLAADDPHDGTLRAFETVELISLGIEGKMALWRSLAAIASSDPSLASVDYQALMARARAQRDLLEPLHTATATAALRRSP